MKSSPFLGLGIIACIFGGIYFVMKGIMVDAEQLFQEVLEVHNSTHEVPANESTGHDDSKLNTQITLYFSSLPKSLKIQQGEDVLLEREDLASHIYSDVIVTNIESHVAEILVEVDWNTPSEQNFVEIELAPENHEEKNAFLRGDSNIQDIAIFEW